MSCIVGPKQIEALLCRYNGIGKPITSDEREILLFALYNESEQREGVAKTARAACDRIWKRQQIVGAEEPVVAQSATPEQPDVAEENRLLREAISPGRIKPLSYYLRVVERMRAKELRIHAQDASPSAIDGGEPSTQECVDALQRHSWGVWWEEARRRVMLSAPL